MKLLRPAKFAELPLECKRVVILAQAPLDQSPRMLAHAWMFAEAGAEVQFVAFGNAEDFPITHPRIHLYALAGEGRDTMTQSIWPMLRGAARMIAMRRQVQQALRAACEGANLIMAQVPPILPGVWLATRQKIPLVLDWHNLSAPVAALKLGKRHPAVYFLKCIEKIIGRHAQRHFTATQLLADHLSSKFSQAVHALPDRPLLHIKNTVASPLAPLDGGLEWYTVVSPTSWSEDEDMEILVDAINKISIPPGKGLRVVVSGKGPKREMFEKRVDSYQRSNLHVETIWLSFSDYLALLSHAHCGVSLHRSASGLDFPMKIIDMETAGLPVLALDYGQALRDGLNGLKESATFFDANDLAIQLEQRIKQDTWPRSQERSEDWHHCWTRLALPVLKEIMT